MEKTHNRNGRENDHYMEGQARTVNQFLKEERLQLLDPCMTGLSYQRADADGNVVICLAVRFAGVVDRERLEQAVKKTVCRFPVAQRCIVQIGHAFFFAKSGTPLPVGEYHDMRLLGGRENGYHSLDVSVKEDQVFFAVDHTLMDGTALLRIVEYLLQRYDEGNDKNTEESSGVFAGDTGDKRSAGLPDTEHAGSSMEEADPFLILRDGDAVRIKGVSSRSFQISFSSNMISDLTELTVPTQDVLFLCHEMETSPAALFALLIAEFLRKAGPKDGKEHIVAQIPIDYRRVLGLPHTMKNAAFSFLADLEDPQWEGMDFSQKAGLLRKKIKEAEDARIARGWIQFYRDYGIAWSMADGHLPVSKDRGGAYTFMLTYLRTSCPECWEGRELIFTGFSAFQDFCMVEYGGKFHIWLRPMKYVDEAGTLRHVFASHGLPVEVSQRKGPSFLAKIPHKRLKT